MCRKEYMKKYREENREKLLQKSREYWSKNKERFNLYQKEYYQKNKEEMKRKRKVYRENNKGKVNALNNKRKCKKIKATPQWLTRKQLEEIKNLYIEASSTEGDFKMHVDHIVPLQGENVSGLHVPWNLQLLTAEENVRKGNKYE